MAGKAEEEIPFPPEEPEVFEIDLPITILELSEDDFLKSEDEEQADVSLKSQVKENSWVETEGEEQVILVEIVKKEDEEMPIMHENLPSFQIVLNQNALESGQNWATGCLDQKMHNGTENECVNLTHFESDLSCYQRMVAPPLSTKKKEEDLLTDGIIQMVMKVAPETELDVYKFIRVNPSEPPCADMDKAANSEGIAALEAGINERVCRPRRSPRLQDKKLLGSKSGESQDVIEEDEQCSGPFVNCDYSLEDVPEDDGSMRKDGCTRHESNTAGYVVQSPVGDCPEEYDKQGNLNDFSRSLESAQQLLVEQSQDGLLPGNEAKRNTSLITAMEKHARMRGALFCNLRDTSSVRLRKHIHAKYKDKRIHKCNFCHRVFFSSAALKFHHKFHSKMISNKRNKNISKAGEHRRKQDKTSVKKKTKKKKTSECGKLFSEMKREQKSSKCFCCTICPFTSSEPTHFLHHVREHNDGPPYQCPQCEYSFDSYLHMLNHLYWHAGYKLCKCCAFLSQYFSSTVKHSYLHRGAKPYLCSVCQLGFTSASSLMRHSTKHNQGKKDNNLPVAQEESLCCPKKYTCDQCNMVFYTYRHFQFHQKYHSQVQDCPRQENGCQATLSLHSSHNKEALNHLLSDEEEGGSQEEVHALKTHCTSSFVWELSGISPNAFVCEYCDLVFHREERFLYHKATHLQIQAGDMVSFTSQECEKSGSIPVVQSSGELPRKLFRCSQCPYTTSSFSSLHAHFNIHTGRKTFKCQECNKAFQSSSHLKQHTLSHLRNHNKCNRCPFIGKTLEDLQLHQETCKDSARKRLQSPPRCEKMKIQISMVDEEGNKNPFMSQEGQLQSYKCQDCDYITNVLDSLKCHTRIHTDERPYGCDVCQRKFRMSSHLKRHKLVHQNWEFFTCQSCDYSTGNWLSFKQHKASHADVQPPCDGQFQKEAAVPYKIYRCEECDYITIRKENLKTHFRIHTGEKPYKCPHCSSAFRTSGCLNKHLATHLKLQCNECQFSATNRRALQKHKKTHKEKKVTQVHKEEETSVAKTYECTKCKVVFSEQQLLHMHHKKHKKTKK